MSVIAGHRQLALLPTQDDHRGPPSPPLFAPQPLRPTSAIDVRAGLQQPIPSSSTCLATVGSPARRPPSRTDKKYKCTFAGCDKAYYKPSRLAEHELTHTGERPHTCPYCSQSYLRASHLTAHLRTHLSEEDRPFACDREECGKRFWTSTHLKRHQEVHDEVPAHKCAHCEMAFTKAHHLRDHVVLAHMPAGTKPYICDHTGCSASFALRNQLKAHEKTHDETRYTCSHDSHSAPPSFATWSALQAHMREAHAPTCPYRECHGRQFKSAQRLKDHLKVHAEREADLEVDLATQVLDDDVPDVILDGMGGGRRKRRRKSEAVKEEGALNKLRRLNDGSAGKRWVCEHDRCDRAFKTKFALASHVSASHLGEKFECPREGCDKAFAHRSNLQRHLAGHDAPLTPRSRSKSREKEKEGLMDDITGASRFAKLKYGCPIRHVDVAVAAAGGAEAGTSAVTSEDGQGGDKGLTDCLERYSRVYDVRRHLASEHGVVLTDMEVRVLLAKHK